MPIINGGEREHPLISNYRNQPYNISRPYNGGHPIPRSAWAFEPDGRMYVPLSDQLRVEHGTVDQQFFCPGYERHYHCSPAGTGHMKLEANKSLREI